MVETVTYLLFVGMVLFAILTIGVAFYRPNDGQTFQIMAGAFNSFLGAFLTKIVPSVLTALKGQNGNGNGTAPSSKPAAAPLEPQSR